MKKSYILIILISFLVISPKLFAQVECPCDFEAVAKDTACWTEQQGTIPEYEERFSVSTTMAFEQCRLTNEDGPGNTQIRMVAGRLVAGVPNFCARRIQVGVREGCMRGSVPLTGLIEAGDMTEEEYFACQCALLEYTTALNMADNNVEVQGGPPYECFEVTLAECRQKVLTPIPTLSEYGMIITAGVLGLFAVIGLFIIRRRKASA